MSTQSKIKQSRKPLKPGKKTSSRVARAQPRDGKRAASKSPHDNPRRIKPLSPSAKSPRLIASFVGMWANDETFDEFIAAMAAQRKAVDADARQP